MPENKTVDPFKPVQPQIPGVSSSDDKPRQPEPSHEPVDAPGIMGPPPNAPAELPEMKLVWVGITLLGALATIFLLFGRAQKAAPQASAAAAPISASARPASVPLLPDAAPIDKTLPIAPGMVATASQLAKPWSAKEFYFRDPSTQKPVPAMVVRLPGGALWGFSLREPYGNCELEYVTDLQKLRRAYGFRANHPMVADPCNKSVFDLMAYGNAPGGLVRGDIAQGSALRPPLAIEMRSQDDQIIAVRTEE
jgi:hypothetical protein